MKKKLLKTFLLLSSVMVLAAGCGETKKDAPGADKDSSSEKSKKDSKKDKDEKAEKAEKNSKKKKEKKEEKKEEAKETNQETDDYGDDFSNDNVVYVSTVDEFMNAIASNTTIILEPGTYNLTEWANEQSVYADGDGSEGYVTNYVSIYESYDGPQVKINYANNLNIYSYDDWDEVQIVCEPRYAFVLEFEGCTDVGMYSMTMGHTPEQGYCSGAVIGLTSCDNMSFEMMDLYGCGTYGVEAYYCNQIYLNTCDIHDCSYGCLDLIYTKGVTCNNVGFYDCAEGFDSFSLYRSGLDLVECSFRNLPEKMISLDSTSYIRLLDCYYDDASLASVQASVDAGEPVLLQTSPDDEDY